jgi:hypothetical protein
VIVGWLAAFATLAGALCIYVASPHQALVRRPVDARAVRWAGIVLLVAALALLLALQGPATAVFTWATGAMLVWSIVPVVARWWRFRGESK